jgi:hypothetical protein
LSGWEIEYFLNGAIGVNDVILLESSTANGYYRVHKVTFDGDNLEGDWTCTAQLLEILAVPKLDVKASTATTTSNSSTSSTASSSASASTTKTYSIGDIVQFSGGKVYSASDAASPANSKVSAGPAKITIIKKGAKHPYHLITQNWSKTHVWGWVDEGSFT